MNELYFYLSISNIRLKSRICCATRVRAANVGNTSAGMAEHTTFEKLVVVTDLTVV